MCFYTQQSQSAQMLKQRFKANFKEENSFQPEVYNGFNFPKTPVICNKNPDEIKLFGWGLIPFWAKDDTIKKHTLNARIETIHEKPSYRNIVHNRCLVIADGFYEWQWLDEKGHKKQKYLLTLPNNALFAFAGLWSEWLDVSSGELVSTYTILTTNANELMSKIHNTKKRMPIILSETNEQNWLQGSAMVMQNENLIANKI